MVALLHYLTGAWAEGDRSLETIYYMTKLRDLLNEKGLAVVSVDYRLITKEIHLPIPVTDCKDAIRWVRTNAARFSDLRI
jgi:acetyl esterase/lipase